MNVIGSAPSNIALIKYMGKTDYADNRPTNSSLSFTLEALRTFVRITVADCPQDQWRPLIGAAPNLIPISLSEKSQLRFMQFFSGLKKQFGVKENFTIESANNFPSDCGLASSASSFAALTRTATHIFRDLGYSVAAITDEQQAQVSRTGSGSSCRSFFGPWSLWGVNGVRACEFPQGNLLHQVIIVDSNKKLVSSSEAHRRVVTSSLFQGRPERAEQRCESLMKAFSKDDWREAFEISWAEFWDMHALFETSSPSFGYMTPESLGVLQFVRSLWSANGDGPLVTMDAGANVHLLYRRDQLAMKHEVDKHFQGHFRTYSADA